MFLIIKGFNTSQYLRDSGVESEYLPEAWRAVDRHVTVSLFKSVVLSDVVKVVTPDDDSPLHLHFDNCTSENTTSD